MNIKMMRRLGIVCSLVLVMVGARAQKPVFYKDILPIINTKCTPCHRQGESAPFALITYEDVAKRGSFIKHVVSAKYMPPWKADNHYTASPFADNRSLTDAERTAIINWVNDKMPAGTPQQSVNASLKKYHPGTAYTRKPDAVLRVKEPYSLKGDNQERFIVFKIPFEFAAPQNVQAMEFISSNKKVIHHANFAVYDVPEGVSLDEGPDFVNTTLGEINQQQYAGYARFKDKMVYYGGWIPGTSFESYPKEVGWVMPKRGVILLTVHYAGAGKDETDISGVNFFFTASPIRRVIDVINLGSGGVAEKDITPYFMIQADSVKTFKLEVTNPEKQSILGVWPHMHLLGKKFKSYAITPQKDTIKLISIPEWDFNWQEIYRYRQPVIIPQGSTLVVEGVYDNTKNNPRNPFNPPRMIFSGGEMKSTDEMMTLILLYLVYKEGDEDIRQ